MGHIEDADIVVDFRGGDDAAGMYRGRIAQLKAELATVKAENQSFGDVLAVIHRDGGHYITKHGHKKASEDAIRVIVDLRAGLREAKEGQ